VSIPTPPRRVGLKTPRYVTHFRNAWTEIKQSPVLRYTFIYKLIGIGLLGELDEYNPLYWKQVGTPLFAVGVLFALQEALASATGLAACRLKRSRYFESLVPLAMGILLVLAGAFPSPAMIGAILLAWVIMAPVEVAIDGRMQRAIAGDSRATVISACCLFCTVLTVPVSLIFGLLSNACGLGSGYMLYGTILVAFAAWTWRREPARERS